MITATEYLDKLKLATETKMLNWTYNLETYLDNNFNVLLRGHKGVGKTSVIKQLFDKKGFNWKYFNGPTMDPWINFVGVPREKDGKLEFILPQDFADDKVEAIFIDEPNRAHKAIRNAILELTQFKSINGRPFKNLRVVWAAINPDDDDSYDVERLDDALLDRFEIQIDVPNQPDLEYFISQYGQLGQRACEWWNTLEDSAKKKISPRKMDHAIRLHKITRDPRPALPKGINAATFISTLNKGSFYEQFMDESDSGKENLINKQPDTVINLFKNNKELAHQYSHLISSEYLNKILEDDCLWLFDTSLGIPKLFHNKFDKDLENKFYSKLIINYSCDDNVINRHALKLPAGKHVSDITWETEDSTIVNTPYILSQLFEDGKLNTTDEDLINFVMSHLQNDVNIIQYAPYYRQIATLAHDYNYTSNHIKALIDIGYKCTN